MAFTFLLLAWKPGKHLPSVRCPGCHHARTQRCMHPLSSPSLTLPPWVKNKMFEEQKHVLFSLSLVLSLFLKDLPMNFHILNYFLPQWWFSSRNALPRFVAFSLSWKNISEYRHFSTGIYVSNSQNSRYYSETLFSKCGVEYNMKS